MIVINRLRKERKDNIDRLKTEKETISKDDRYSNEHRFLKVKEIDDKIKAIEDEYNPQIEAKIQELESSKLKEYYNAEFDLTEGQIMKELLITQRVNARTVDLVEEFKGKPVEYIKNQLGDTLKDMVEGNSPYARAVISAMRRLGVNGIYIDSLEGRYESQNLNGKQERAKAELGELESVKVEYKREVEGDPFANVMAKYK